MRFIQNIGVFFFIAFPISFTFPVHLLIFLSLYFRPIQKERVLTIFHLVKLFFVIFLQKFSLFFLKNYLFLLYPDSFPSYILKSFSDKITRSASSLPFPNTLLTIFLTFVFCTCSIASSMISLTSATVTT